jgi:hypothetical protein
MYATLGEHDLVLVVSLTGAADSDEGSVALVG